MFETLEHQNEIRFNQRKKLYTETKGLLQIYSFKILNHPILFQMINCFKKILFCTTIMTSVTVKGQHLSNQLGIYLMKSFADFRF